MNNCTIHQTFSSIHMSIQIHVPLVQSVTCTWIFSPLCKEWAPQLVQHFGIIQEFKEIAHLKTNTLLFPSIGPLLLLLSFQIFGPPSKCCWVFYFVRNPLLCLTQIINLQIVTTTTKKQKIDWLDENSLTRHT
jgi:hypothetical protein